MDNPTIENILAFVNGRIWQVTVKRETDGTLQITAKPQASAPRRTRRKRPHRTRYTRHINLNFKPIPMPRFEMPFVPSLIFTPPKLQTDFFELMAKSFRLAGVPREEARLDIRLLIPPP